MPDRFTFVFINGDHSEQAKAAFELKNQIIAGRERLIHTLKNISICDAPQANSDPGGVASESGPPILRVIHGPDARAASVSYTATQITNLRIRSNRSVNFFENT